ncbi:hypothetical protein CEXT_727101 [Caerostris extrusa]|uniref:Uncharacterized protein n=1 Tax=Caerostris extrusa TaxID=172846 RepID=A0AAV4NC29_CAEEX|nr:hypothetical protein CEXT_727101 [Caerostris extrusa]
MCRVSRGVTKGVFVLVSQCRQSDNHLWIVRVASFFTTSMFCFNRTGRLKDKTSGATIRHKLVTLPPSLAGMAIFGSIRTCYDS